MTTEREFHRNHSTLDVVSVDDDAVAPNRVTKTSRLTAPTNPQPSGLVMRKARDANGVAAGADDMVAAASASGGSALPVSLMRKFESSLGADLSSVRVHTDAASATAAEAVGARAYTIGQDIYFAAGQYNPTSGSGEHLLAHEVAHTVQQRGGTPMRQNKLEVSSPHDAAEHEADRAADAMVNGRTASLAGTSGLTREVMRNAGGQSAPTPGAALSTEFDASEIPPQVIAAIDALTVDALRTMATGSVNHAYTNYLAACSEVKGKLAEKDKQKEEANKEMMSILIGAVGIVMGLTPIAAAVGKTLSGEAIIDRVASLFEKQLNAGGVVGVQTLAALTAPVIKRLTSERFTALAAKLTPKGASSIVSFAADKTANVVAKIDTRGSREKKAISYVDALVGSADTSSSTLLDAVGACNDVAALIAVHQKFSAATVAVYRAEVETKADHFASQVAGTIGNKGRDQVVKIDAYGRERLATVHYVSDSANYAFRSWVTPDMEPTVRMLHPHAFKVSASHIADHLPEPTKEGAVYGQELIVRTDAYGRERLATAKADRGFFETNWGQLHFLGWVTTDEEVVARVKGAAQIGGVPHVDPGQLHGLSAPSDK